MRNLSAGLLALALLLSLLPAPPARAATPAPKPPAGSGAKDRNDYANALFTAPLAVGLKHFYGRSFKEAQADFERALAVIPDNTLAIFFLNASAAQQTGELDVLTNIEEDAVGGAPKSYVNHVRLGVTYLFAVVRDRTLDARGVGPHVSHRAQPAEGRGQGRRDGRAAGAARRRQGGDGPQAPRRLPPADRAVGELLLGMGVVGRRVHRFVAAFPAFTVGTVARPRRVQMACTIG